MSSIQAYKAHNQEGTIAATTLVSKLHKQLGASSNSQGVQHNYRLAKNTKEERTRHSGKEDDESCFYGMFTAYP